MKEVVGGGGVEEGKTDDRMREKKTESGNNILKATCVQTVVKYVTEATDTSMKSQTIEPQSSTYRMWGRGEVTIYHTDAAVNLIFISSALMSNRRGCVHFPDRT